MQKAEAAVVRCDSAKAARSVFAFSTVIPAQAGIQPEMCAVGAPYLTMEAETSGSAWGSHGSVHGELRCGYAAVCCTGFPPKPAPAKAGAGMTIPKRPVNTLKREVPPFLCPADAA